MRAFLPLLRSQFPQIAVTSKLLFIVVAAAFTILVTSATFTILVTGTFLTILVTSTTFAILVTGTFLTILMTSATFTVLVTGTALAILVTGTALTLLMASTALAILVVTAVVSAFAGIVVAASMSGTTAATSGTFFGTAAGGQLGTGSRISLHIVGVVTQLAHLLTQLVGIGSLRIIVDGQLRRFHIVRVRLHALEIRHVLFEFVGALLAHTIGLNRHGLLPFGGRFALLRIRAQRNQAY